MRKGVSGRESSGSLNGRGEFSRWPKRAYGGTCQRCCAGSEDVRPTGFSRNKARAIRDACPALVEILTAAQPSPLSAKKSFGSRPFSAINAALRSFGKPSIDWRLPKWV